VIQLDSQHEKRTFVWQLMKPECWITKRFETYRFDMIKTVAFDLGGVIVEIDNEEPTRRFQEIGVQDATTLLDPYTQAGIFGDLEHGKISEEEFRQQLSAHVGHELTWQQCQYAWLGYAKSVPKHSFPTLLRLREMGYRVVLASNTNGFMQSWVDSEKFSGDGHAVSFYFDELYRSYEMKEMKPDEGFFSYILSHENILPENMLFIDDSPRNCAIASKMGVLTYCPENGTDWTGAVMDILQKDRR